MKRPALDYWTKLWRGDKYAHLRDSSAHVRSEDHAVELVEKMVEKSPRWQSFYRGVNEWDRMGVMDQKTFKGLATCFPTMEMDWIGTMPLDMLMFLQDQDPDILQDKERVYKFLKKHKQFKVPGSRNEPIRDNLSH